MSQHVDPTDWYERSEESLRDAYLDYLLNSKVMDIQESIFWFETAPEKLAAEAKKAKQAYDDWVAAKFEEYCEICGPEREAYEDR